MRVLSFVRFSEVAMGLCGFAACCADGLRLSWKQPNKTTSLFFSFWSLGRKG